MPYALIGIGIVLAWLDYQGTANLSAAGSLLKQELFTNSDPFYKWLGAIVIVGLIGYVPELRKFSVAMLVLIILSIALSKNHSGVLTKLEGAL